MRIAFLTLGCKVNSYETEKMKRQFQDAGDWIVSFGEEADIYMVNTCTVTNIADRKSRQMLHRARKKNPQALIVATGCYVDSALARGERDDSVDVFVQNAQKEQVVELVRQAWQEKSMREILREASDEEFGGESAQAKDEEHTRAYLKVQSGCNQYCTYCIIPYVRGALTSKPVREVLKEVGQLAAQGIKEIVITGIHLSSYGVDDYRAGSFLELQGKPLLELLEAVNAVEGIERIRLGSLEPRIVTAEFARRLSGVSKLCPHFHLSLQSGCDDTLKRMNRHYTGEEYLEGVGILRSYFENPAITTDIIVGFPGETEEAFQTTCEFVRKAAFSQIHVFKYSRRKGTVADRLPEQLTEQQKAKYSDRLLEIGRQLEQEYRRAFLGKREKILIEESALLEGCLYFVGYTTRYVRVAVPAAVFLPGACEEENQAGALQEWRNRIVEVQLMEDTASGYVIGK